MRHNCITEYTAHKCRCDRCKAWKRVYEAKRKMGRVRVLEPATRARHHIAFLRTGPWSLPTIAQACNVDRETIRKIACGKTARIDARTNDKILGLYLNQRIARTDNVRTKQEVWSGAA